MPIIQFHTPQGIIPMDSDTVTDKELASLHITREVVNELIPRGLATEVDELKAEIAKLKLAQKYPTPPISSPTTLPLTKPD